MLELHELSRRFGEHLAVDGVSFTVPDARMVGFVGGNGAGKTTTMRMIMGVLAPSAGEVHWDGAPVTRADRMRFGYMPEERGLYPKQPVLGQLTYLGQLHGMSQNEARERSEELLVRFGLGERLKSKVETLSLGNQQRAQIIASV
ncbi:MAG: ABC transporter ATP-binding protein, partial [Arsenicicoccus sp.]